MVGSGVGAKHGILYKNATALEQCGRTEIVALDKTGTITEGEPKVTGIIPADGVTEEELLRYAFVAEQYSEHPIAKAIISRSTELGITGAQACERPGVQACGMPDAQSADSCDTCADDRESPEAFKALSGNGVCGMYRGKELLGGNLRLLGEIVPKTGAEAAEAASREGGTPVFFAYDGRYLGMIIVADTLRKDSVGAMALLRKMGITAVCVTGDRRTTAEFIAARAGITEVRAEVLPDGKQQVIRELQGSDPGRRIVAMVGDGINDAPALTAADIGIAIGAGTEVAIDAGDVVVMNRRLTDVCAAIDLGRNTLRIIRQNLWWAFFYNVIGIPLAAGAFIRLFGWELNPMFGAAAMSLSSFCVVMNALRLNRWKYPEIAVTEEITGILVAEEHAGKAETAAAQEAAAKETAVESEDNRSVSTEEIQMKEVTLQIKGMMCQHCEARVKKCLEEIPGVAGAVVSHEKGTAVVTAEESVSEAAMAAAVTAQGYEVV